MKKFFFMVLPLIFVCILLVTGCSKKPAVLPGAGMAFEDIYYPTESSIVGMSGTLTLLGNSLEDLYEEADIVVLATVIKDDVAQYENNYISYCLSKVHVTSVYKGDIAINDKIVIREIGGKIEKTTKEYSLDGVPLLHNDMRVLLFLRNEAELPNGMKGHTICGEYQGKFIFDTKGMLHESAELGQDSFTVINDMDKMTYATVTANLQTMCNEEIRGHKNSALK